MYCNVPGPTGILNREKESFTRDELKEALKNFKASRDDVQDPNLQSEDPKKKFRSMEKIREEFEEMELSMKTDVEILRELLAQYQEGDISVEQRVLVLKDLEYYVHQVTPAFSWHIISRKGMLSNITHN